MSPTPEQVAQWAREAGLQDLGSGFNSFIPCTNSIIGGKFVCPTSADLQALVTRAFTEGRARQAEQDAKLCDDEWNGDADTYAATEAYNECAAAIRANAPKGTM